MNRSFHRSLRWLAVAMAIGAQLATDCGTEANEDLREPIAMIAQAVAQITRARGLDSVAIGEFTGPPTFGSSAGPGIRKLLAEELARLDVREKRLGAAIGLQGRYFPDTSVPSSDPADRIPARLRIEVSLVDPQNGDVLTALKAPAVIDPNDDPAQTGTIPITNGKLSVDATDAAILAAALGGNSDLQFNADEAFPDGDDVLLGFVRPTAVIHNGTAVSASRTSPFLMEILVDDQPHRLALAGGQPFVELGRGDSFQIRVHNRAEFDAAVAFTLDGVSSFAFSEVRHDTGPQQGRPRYTRWIIPAGQTFTLKGWHRTNQLVDKFLVTDFSQSAAARLGSAQDVGTITATFRASWKWGADPPRDEPARPVSFSAAIGRGDSDGQVVQENREQREYGQPRAVVTVRYIKPDSH